MDHDRIALYAGRRLEDMSRDELIEVIHELGRAVERERAMHGHTLEVWEAARRARCAGANL